MCLVGENAHFPIAAIFGMHRFTRGFDHQIVMPCAISDQIGNGADLEFMLGGKVHQLAQTGHGAIIIHDLADHAGGVQPRKAGNIHRRLGMAGAD